jgi:hypothetical protein
MSTGTSNFCHVATHQWQWNAFFFFLQQSSAQFKHGVERFLQRNRERYVGEDLDNPSELIRSHMVQSIALFALTTVKAKLNHPNRFSIGPGWSQNISRSPIMASKSPIILSKCDEENDSDNNDPKHLPIADSLQIPKQRFGSLKKTSQREIKSHRNSIKQTG